MQTFYKLLFVLVLLFFSTISFGQEPQLEYNINPHGTNVSSNPNEFIQFNETLYFLAQTDGTHQSLWIYGGDNEPQKVQAPEQPEISSNSFLIEYNNKLFFVANDNIHGNELWSYDPNNGYQLADDISEGQESSVIASPFIINNKLFFTFQKRENYNTCYTIYEYDGTNSASEIENMLEGGLALGINSKEVINDTLYFTAQKDIFSYEELYEFDGVNTPKQVEYNGERAKRLITFNNELHFVAKEQYSSAKRLWKYDGVNEPEQVATPLVTITPLASTSGKLFISWDNKIYINNGTSTFQAIDNVKHNSDINSSKKAYCANDNVLYFFAYNNNYEVFLWKYEDGITAEALTAVPFYDYSINELVFFDNQLIFKGNSGNGIELQIFDLENKALSEHDLKTGTDGSSLNNLFVFNNKLHFSATDSSEQKFWKYNENSSPEEIADTEEAQWDELYEAIVFNDKVVFSGRIDDYGIELMEYDGVNPPSMIADIYEGGLWGYPEHFTEFNSNLYFSAENDTAGVELWKYDGNNAPQLVADIIPGNESSSPENLIVFNDKLYFSAEDSALGKELWSMDSDEIVQLEFDCREGEYDSNPKLLTVFNNKLYFSAYVEIIGTSLWEFNGKDEPVNLKATKENWAGIVPHDLVVFNNNLILSAYTDSTGIELWSYDGETTPQQIADINPGNESSNPSNFKVINQTLYFAADDGVHGTELWSYNGNDAPQMIADIFEGKGSSTPENFTLLDNKVYFVANDGTDGRELWSFVPNLDTYSEETVIACGEYLSPGGNVYTENGVYTDTLANNAGADSIITTHLTIEHINREVNVVNDTLLHSLHDNASYQWINCETKEEIEAATEQEFIATKNGDYAVIVFTEHCTDTSECVNVIRTSVDKQNLAEIIVSPNPSHGHFSVHLGQVDETAEITIVNTSGSIVERKTVNNSFADINLNTKPGIYFIKITIGSNTFTRKIILE
jgi:ELWxxDGT repeat protein